MYYCIWNYHDRGDYLELTQPLGFMMVTDPKDIDLTRRRVKWARENGADVGDYLTYMINTWGFEEGDDDR